MHALPDAHRAFLEGALPILRADARVTSVVISGSAVTGGIDPWSDLDLVVFVEDSAEAALTVEHFDIVARLGKDLLSAFRGDHVGEPRVLICLYDDPLLHVDVKFMAHKDAATLHYPAEVLWSRDEPPSLPGPGPARAFDVQWCANRIATWAHYVGVKIERGELFEALHSLDYLRTRVLAPLIAVEAGFEARALRRIEETQSPRLESLARTVCGYDRNAALASAKEAFRLAWSLVDGHGDRVHRNRTVEQRTTAFLDEISARMNR
jgi:predicted nucleotidyltransferase